ncbi:MAG: sigma 54-interacting transcriptional regulator [Desulfococcaceae bacterium]|jgi:DNA-binding NtrC family response regulator|nr:sigma 54-interacting transcriptional regulator [Desulfococcaceae bacterium]
MGKAKNTNQDYRLLQDMLEEIKKQNDVKDEEEKKQKIREQFEALVEPVTAMGEELNSYGGKGLNRGSTDMYALPGHAELSFCGFLEGDFSERSYLQTPITFSGGFFLRTHVANILFDPGNGTITGMRDMGIRLNPETDIIIVSHYHPQARLDLHTIFNELGGYCPGRSESDKSREKKVHFFSTEAVIHGRNEHPALLIPSDKKVISGLYVTTPGNAWKITKGNNICTVEKTSENTEPDENSLILKTFPAYHSEVVSDTDGEDTEGKEGKAVSCFFIQAKTYGILFTGDTECPLENGKWSEEIIEQLKDNVTVLIANMKTVEYLSGRKDNEKRKIEWDNLYLTDNQLGFEGTKKLAQKLNPKALVIRALGLECVVEKDDNNELKYAPQNLAVIREAMELALKETKGNHTQYIIIPGRHQVTINPERKKDKQLNETILIPAFSKTGLRKYGKKGAKETPLFVTVNPELAKEIDMYIAELKKKNIENPYLLIQGESGSGKSALAEAIVTELVKSNDQKDKIKHYDLATAGSGEIFGSDLFGWKEGAFTGAKENFEGYFGIDKGLLILNQLEKLEQPNSVKFLDVLENRSYRQMGSTEDRETNARLIFTSNIDIDNPKSLLTEDMKNRLRHRILNIPRLSTLPLEMKHAEISEFIKFWCEKEQAVIDNRAWEMLPELDFSRGAFRMLSGLLHKAKWMTEKEYGINTSDSGVRSPVFISMDFIEEARKKLGIDMAKEDASDNEKPRKEIAWIMAVWISHRCEKKKTYDLILGPKGGTMGPRAFERDVLSEFRKSFEVPEDAWNFFHAPESLDILKREKDIGKYVETLNVKNIGKEADDIFNFEAVQTSYKTGKREWLAQRGRELAEVLNDPGKTKDTFLNIMGKKK